MTENSKNLTLVEISGKVKDGDITETRELILNDAGISSVDDLYSMKSLEKITLAGNSIKDFDFLCQNIKLQSINLSRNLITKISRLQHLECLSLLNLSNNNIEVLDNIDCLPSLRVLILNNNKLRNVPNLSQLTNLETVILSHNSIDTFTLPIRLMPRLRKITLSHNNLREFPLTDKFPGLHELRLNSNKIISLPHNLGLMNSIKVLDLGNNRLIDLKPLCNLVNLQDINLSGNKSVDVDLEELQKNHKFLRIVNSRKLNLTLPEVLKKPSKKFKKRLLSIFGPESFQFLQGLVTADLNKLNNNVFPALLLSSSGRLLADALISKKDDGFLIECGDLETVLNIINRRKLAAKITYKELSNAKVYARLPRDFQMFNAQYRNDYVENFLELQDSRGISFGNRIYTFNGDVGNNKNQNDHKVPLSIYDKVLILNGLVVEFINNKTDLKLLPQDLNLHNFGYVSKNKGCYIGQEIMNRLNNKTLINKYKLQVAVDTDVIEGVSAMDAALSFPSFPFSSALSKILGSSGHNVALKLLNVNSYKVNVESQDKSIIPLAYFSNGFGFILSHKSSNTANVVLNNKIHKCNVI